MVELSSRLGPHTVLVYVFLVMLSKHFKGPLSFAIDTSKDSHCVNAISINYGDEFIER